MIFLSSSKCVPPPKVEMMSPARVVCRWKWVILEPRDMVVRALPEEVLHPLLGLVEYLSLKGQKRCDNLLVLISPTYEKILLWNSLWDSSQEVILIDEENDLNQCFAFHSREKGNYLSLSKSSSTFVIWMVLHTSRNSSMCLYGFSFSIPRKYDNMLMIEVLIS